MPYRKDIRWKCKHKHRPLKPILSALLLLSQHTMALPCPSVKDQWHNGRGDSFCVASSNDTDRASEEDSFVLNRSYPCARRPAVKKNLSLQRWADGSTGEASTL